MQNTLSKTLPSKEIVLNAMKSHIEYAIVRAFHEFPCHSPISQAQRWEMIDEAMRRAHSILISYTEISFPYSWWVENDRLMVRESNGLNDRDATLQNANEYLKEWKLAMREAA